MRRKALQKRGGIVKTGWGGNLNYMAGFAGWDYSKLLEAILSAAQERCAVTIAAET